MSISFGYAQADQKVSNRFFTHKLQNCFHVHVIVKIQNKYLYAHVHAPRSDNCCVLGSYYKKSEKNT